MKKVIDQLTKIGARQGPTALKAAKIIMAELSRARIAFEFINQNVVVPVTVKASLKVDGKSIPCLGTSFVGGKVTKKDFILSSTIPSRFVLDLPNINFSPDHDGIGCNNYYFAPAVAIDRKDLLAVVKVEKVEGNVIVKKWQGKLPQILVGNTKNPRTIIFSHYDSIGPGAIDNASGVAVMLGAIVAKPELLRNVLFVFDGNEELSYTKPTYWGEGYRQFEKSFKTQLAKAKKVIVVDCVGNGPTKVSTDQRLLKLAFPIVNQGLLKKTCTLHGDIKKLMAVYHSELDTADQVNEKDLRGAVRVLIKQIAV